MQQGLTCILYFYCQKSLHTFTHEDGTPNLTEAIQAISSLVRSSGHLVFPIYHPCFWSKYWGHDSALSLYEDEIAIEAPFVIECYISAVWPRILQGIDPVHPPGIHIDQIGQRPLICSTRDGFGALATNLSRVTLPNGGVGARDRFQAAS